MRQSNAERSGLNFAEIWELRLHYRSLRHACGCGVLRNLQRLGTADSEPTALDSTGPPPRLRRFGETAFAWLAWP